MLVHIDLNLTVLYLYISFTSFLENSRKVISTQLTGLKHSRKTELKWGSHCSFVLQILKML